MSAFHQESMQHGMMLINAKTGTPMLNKDGTTLFVQPVVVNPGQGASYMYQQSQVQQPQQMVMSQPYYVGMQWPVHVVPQQPIYVSQPGMRQYAPQQTIQEHQDSQFGDRSEGECPFAGEEEMDVESLMSGDHRELREEVQKLSERITILERQLVNSLNWPFNQQMNRELPGRRQSQGFEL